ncbi:anion transporter [Anabaena cylindrica FACHB-243]|uniref:Transporter, YbiR family n=1 Tax=Anabaena cylindrica (strain ATCC 27899 / PCC 7122) TaxID=272123 RepID=K9ZR87_ANACC|nr:MULTISPECIES: anion transporter [Anabaena]AFZ60890.1 transporter, YbiR family [Anabaena cylindrica PCC 7122]MBD2420490.1 anion transporter [Anabaena cylindrica FACHB-243]MBY5285743.1 anion transporter [Anabaena sp. CCAP 1446/1C]MBY5309935.1 anion transporter [Anabaena sp. CCAP 1446/1C]MCM2406885.1 anion transporter [Anabaena sp. CCAP 1446/1C]
MLKFAIYGVLGLTYLGLALGYIPGLRMNRATIALVGSAFLIALGVLTLQEAWLAIDAKTIVFLLSMMVVNANLSYAGFFSKTLSVLLSITRSPLGLLLALTFGSGVLSAFFLNDTLALVFTPLTLSLTQALGLNPIPYLLAIAGATNIGSVATLSGNPQNILIGSFSGISYLDFLQALTPIAITGLVIQVALLWLLYPDVRSNQPCQLLKIDNQRIFKPLFKKTVIITTGLLIAFAIGLPLAESALVAASLLLITRRIKAQRILKKVDWNLLVMFSGLFILTKVTQKLNFLQPFTHVVKSDLGLLGITTIMSNLISNVPTVLLLQPLIAQDDTRSWLLLAASSTLAGNLTLFGAVANLITVEAAAELGYKLTFWEHLRFGVPLTLSTLVLVYLWVN